MLKIVFAPKTRRCVNLSWGVDVARTAIVIGKNIWPMLYVTMPLGLPIHTCNLSHFKILNYFYIVLEVMKGTCTVASILVTNILQK